MGGAPMGFQWEAVYPLMERLGLGNDDWNQLHDDLMLMESAALETIRKFAPKD